MSCNVQLGELIDRMQLPIVTFQVRQLLPLDQLERFVQEHGTIAEAILAGNADEAIRPCGGTCGDPGSPSSICRHPPSDLKVTRSS